MGCGIGGPRAETQPVQPIRIPQGARAGLAQEIRNARGGHYTFEVRACGGAESREAFDTLFRSHFTCRLVLFRFADATKDPRRIQELASAVFQPTFAQAVDASSYQRFVVSQFLGSTVPGANFGIGQGLGVAVIVEKTSPGALEFGADAQPNQAFIRIDSVAIDFNPRPRDDSVVV